MPIQYSTSASTVGDLLSASKVYCLPEFQRPYSWSDDRAFQLFDDIQNACVKDADEFLRTPLMEAVDKDHPVTTGVLLKAKANPNRKDKRGETALTRAVKRSKPKLVSLLLKHGGNVSQVDGDKVPLLILAIREKQADILKMLLAAGADPNAATSEDRTALQAAALAGFSVG